MHLIVLDTNCLLQILPSRSIYHPIWNAILDGTISLCVNTEILDEYEEILGQRMTPAIAHSVVEAIARLSTTYHQQSYIHFDLIQTDRDDNKFVDCAIAAGAEFIVSNDAHFEVLKSIDWPKVIVLKITDFYQFVAGS